MVPFALSDLLLLAEHCLRLGEVGRATTHRDGRRETDTTHSVMVAVVGAALAERLNLPLNAARLLSMALIHDLPESLAGDTPTLAPLRPAAERRKAHREAQAVSALRRELRGRWDWVVRWLAVYGEQAVVEARYVWAVDKLVPKFVHHLNDFADPLRDGVTGVVFEARLRGQMATVAKLFPEPRMGPFVVLFEAVLEDSIRRYWIAARREVTYAQGLASVEDTEDLVPGDVVGRGASEPDH